MPPSPRHWILTRAAILDLEEIWRYTFERWSMEQADSYHNDMIGMINELAAGHRRGRKVAVPDRF